MFTIMGDRALLGALQLSDSALPIGRFVHSHGLEAWSREHPRPRPGELAELIEASVCESFATLDVAVLAHAHRARSIESLLSLDSALAARKLTPSARTASQTCGRRLAALAPQLAPADRLAAELAELVRSGETDGHLAVVQGALARALGLSTRAAVLVELRGAAATLLSAAVRLAIVAPTRAQVILAELAPALADAAERALTVALEELSATTPELELYSLVHARHDGRMFQT
jgi:urease accessory protein